MIEEWKDIPNYINYEVSNTGKVRSKKKEVRCRGDKYRTLTEKVLKPIVKMYGEYKDHPRLLVNLYYDTGLYKTKQVSRLVAESFIEGYSKYLLVLHNDNDTYNNNVNNLRVGTYSDNNKQAWDDGRQRVKRI
jgi:hypothetical protein